MVEFGVLNKNMKRPPQDTKLNRNFYSRNNPFVPLSLTQKGTTAINIYVVFVLFQAFNQIIKPTVK